MTNDKCQSPNANDRSPESEGRQSATDAPSPNPDILRRVYRFLARLDVAAGLILVVFLLAALGSWFPQMPRVVAESPERLAAWEAAARAPVDVAPAFQTMTGFLGVVFRRARRSARPSRVPSR